MASMSGFAKGMRTASNSSLFCIWQALAQQTFLFLLRIRFQGILKKKDAGDYVWKIDAIGDIVASLVIANARLAALGLLLLWNCFRAQARAKPNARLQ